ncbi:TPA_asm: tail fiber domain-containing protein [Salmonella enterica]|nr:tail fiber domain-containing protein [Salmonella enterica]HAA0720008.1 tail fiber domain-containing protein [Salmonella enterica]
MCEALFSAILITVLFWRFSPLLSAPQLSTPEGFILPEPEEETKAWEETALFKKGGGVDIPDPDPGIHDAAYKLGDLGDEALEFFKQAYAEGTSRQDVIDEAAKHVVGNMMGMSDDAKSHSEELWNRYENKYVPVEDRVIDDAMNWDSADNQAASAAQAKADVNTSTAQQQAATERQQEAMGVDPTSGRYQSLDSQADTQAALNAADAENAARTQRQQEAVQMREGVAQQGLQEAGLGNQTASLAGSLGSGGINTGLAANQGFYQNAGLMGTGYGLDMKGQQGKGSLLLSEYQAQLAAAGAEEQANAANMGGMMSGIGSLAGAYLNNFAGNDPLTKSITSSKSVKENKKPVSGALNALNGLNIQSWKYKDGVEDSGQHIGPYAEDWQRVTGLGNGQSIPVVDAVGVTMKAVQELNDKVDQMKGNNDE